jgi:putative membrane protein
MNENPEKYKRLIVVLSIVIPIAVAALFGIKIPGYDFSFLPPIYASINGLTAILLITSFMSIKNGNRSRHEFLNKTCLVLSGLFLVMYILYHITSEATRFGGEGIAKYVYYFILVTHIILSVVVIPFVLFTFSRALAGNFERHKRLAKFTFPLWLYVAVTGVIVYFMISPYYK